MRHTIDTFSIRYSILTVHYNLDGCKTNEKLVLDPVPGGDPERTFDAFI